MSKRLYLGIAEGGGREVFLSATVPTERSHGQLFLCAVGPFRTRRGANFMRDYGRGNPHCRCVAEAERLAAG